MGYRRSTSISCKLGPERAVPVLAGPAQWLLESLHSWAQREGREAPILLSTVRSAAKQLEMQKRWDAGDRRGLAVRPADPKTSKHVPDANGDVWAFDLGNTREWLINAGVHVMSREMRITLPGIQWGGNFLTKDFGHFEISGMKAMTSIKLS